MQTETDQKKEQNPEASWEYKAEAADSTAASSETSTETPPESAENEVSWSASEYIAHEKDYTWYLAVSAVVLVIAGAVYFFDDQRGWFSPMLIIIAGITFIIAAKRPPKVVEYTIDSSGLYIGKKLYNYAQFKSFSIIQEGPITSIVLTPLQRFMPSLTVYFEPKDQDKISDALSIYLPHETKKQDLIDTFMRKIRF